MTSDFRLGVVGRAYRARQHAIGKDFNLPDTGTKNGSYFHNFWTDFQDFGIKHVRSEILF